MAIRNPAKEDMTEESYKKLNELEMSSPLPDGGPSMTTDDNNSGGSIAMLPAGMPMTGGRAVDFITRTALDAQMSSDEVRTIAARVQNQAIYPGSVLGNSLKLVAKLIGGGLPTRIYYASQGRLRYAHNQIKHATTFAPRPRRFGKGVRGRHEGARKHAASFSDDVQRIWPARE